MTLKKNYFSPRWSGEICDCSMPMTLDTYSECSFNCLYCFAFFQKSHSCTGYKEENNVTRSVNVDKIKKIFQDCENNQSSNQQFLQFMPYIQERLTLQWGGMGDPFDKNEEKYNISLELLKFFDKIDYPLSISTKGTFFVDDERYMKLIRKHPHNWHFKISIITLNKEKASIIEEGVAPPRERLKIIQKLSQEGIPVTLRLRPYIIGLSEDYPELIKEAKKHGARSVSTEFFCLESRANKELKQKYKQISQLVGYNIWSFYKKHSHGAGYHRLNYNIKRKIINNMRNITHQQGMKFYVSDSHHKEKSDGTCCCGCPQEFNIFRGQFSEALQIAKNNKEHIVRWENIKDNCQEILGNVSWYTASGFQTGSSREQSLRLRQSLYDYVHEIWNTPQKRLNPYNYFGGVLYPIGLDEHDDIIYKYNIDQANKGVKNGK